MKRVIVNITDDLTNVPNLEELTHQEHALAGKWKQEGILENLLIKEANNGAVLIMKNVDEAKAKTLIESFPLFPYFEKVDYILVDQKF